MTTPSVESAPIVERLRDSVTIGFHSDGYGSIGIDEDGKTVIETRSPTPMTRLANRDGPEAADTITELLEALEPFAALAMLAQPDEIVVAGSYPIIITNGHCKAAFRAIDRARGQQ